MAAFPSASHLSRLLPAGAGVLAALVAAGVIVLLPVASLENLVWTSGIASFVAAAQPPLGTTARAALALGGGIGTGAVMWAALFLLIGPGGFFAPAPREADAPSVRRADRHPDAPPRRPMTAADLGTPLMDVAPRLRAQPPVEQPLPSDLDQPLAAFDPAAVPLVARQPVRAVASLSPALAPGERLDTFTLTPPPPTRPASTTAAPSIDSLLHRLEAGASRRAVRL